MLLKRILIILGIMCITSLSCAGLLILGNKINDNEIDIYKEESNIVDIKKEIDSYDWSYLEQSEDNRITLITCISNKPNMRLCIQGIEEKNNIENIIYY